MSDNLFYTLAHTPLDLQGIEKSGHKILVCLSNHEFSIKEHHFRRSGLVVRDDEDGVNNIQSILDKNPEAVALVSQIAKKYFDKETALAEYKALKQTGVEGIKFRDLKLMTTTEFAAAHETDILDMYREKRSQGLSGDQAGAFISLYWFGSE